MPIADLNLHMPEIWPLPRTSFVRQSISNRTIPSFSARLGRCLQWTRGWMNPLRCSGRPCGWLLGILSREDIWPLTCGSSIAMPKQSMSSKSFCASTPMMDSRVCCSEWSRRIPATMRLLQRCSVLCWMKSPSGRNHLQLLHFRTTSFTSKQTRGHIAKVIIPKYA